MKEHIKKFKEWIAKSDEHRKTAQLWFRHYRIERSIEFLEQYNADALWKDLERVIRKRKRNYRLIYASSAVAASLLLIPTLIYLLPDDMNTHKKQPASISGTQLFSEAGGKKAILTLHTGEEIDVANRADQFIANAEDTLLLINPDKSLIYSQNKESGENTVKYNTLTVPRGSDEYRLVLPDGTKVWLNAESSLRYPVSFAQTMDVNLTGEAYFEVSKSDRAFIVHAGVDRKVETIGTKFNVSAYTDDFIYTTLAEGKVKVHNVNTSVTLLPNQQAIAGKADGIAVETVDATLYTSWTQGVFQFRKTRLCEIIDQLSRWYDVNIVFDNERLKHKLFTGVIFRRHELGFAVETIEKTSNVKFIIENDTIYITNQKK